MTTYQVNVNAGYNAFMMMEFNCRI